MNSDDIDDVAKFVSHLAEEKAYYYLNTVCLVFADPTIKIMDRKTAKWRLKEIMEEKGIPAKQAWYHLSDILKARFCVHDIEELKHVVT